MADKKLYIDNQLSFTIWLKTSKTEVDANYFFTYPGTADTNKNSQLYIIHKDKAFILCFEANEKKVIKALYNNFIGKWTHITIVLTQDLLEIITANCYINGEIVKNQLEPTEHFLKPEDSVFLTGFVLGNNVDTDRIHHSDEFANAEMSELYMYNRVLTDDEIMSAFHHKAPVKGRIISWEEFSTTLDGKTDVSIKPYPKELFWGNNRMISEATKA